jgi:hypothetical protein
MVSRIVAALHSGDFSSRSSAVRHPRRMYAGSHLLRSRSVQQLLLVQAIRPLTEIVDAFKLLLGFQQHYVPRSEYFFKLLQPMLEDQFLLGETYELLFDQFEILLALVFADMTTGTPIDHVWGPPGRFAWKHSRGDVSPYNQLVDEAKLADKNWGPMKAGLFQASPQRFSEIASAYGQAISRLGWW